jgi:acyl-CoA synthetase (AMP-forming)/AMP-acid ligase II
MAGWMNLGQNLKVNAKKFPNTVMLKDSQRSFTYPEVNKRVNQLSHSLLSLGLSKGDKVAVLLENSIEIVEVFLATAKTGIIIVPVNFRLVSAEVEYIAERLSSMMNSLLRWIRSKPNLIISPRTIILPSARQWRVIDLTTGLSKTLQTANPI